MSWMPPEPVRERNASNPLGWYALAWKNGLDFEGRARRSEYWWFTLFNWLIVVLLMIVDSVVFGDSGVVLIPVLVYMAAVFIPNFSLTVRRLHDIGRSGWWMLVGLVPYIGALVLFIFSVLESEPGSNLYGPNPKEPTHDLAEVF